MNDLKKEILILGIGNDILMDDGIGPRLVIELQKTIQTPNINFLTAATGGMEILELIRDYRQVIIIDAIKTRNGVPGTMYHLTPSGFKETLHISSFHDVSFLTALKLAEKLKINIPEQIDIIAIEIVEDMTFGTEFSPLIRDNFSTIHQNVLREVRFLIEKE
jgi:hydrogenase maturation protease